MKAKAKVLQFPKPDRRIDPSAKDMIVSIEAKTIEHRREFKLSEFNYISRPLFRFEGPKTKQSGKKR